jgi:hypothetical protein
MQIRYIFLLFFFINTCFCNNFHFFNPPTKWKLADPKYLSPMVEVCFLGKSNTSFHPSINIATEQLVISQEEYLLIVKQIHQDDPNISYKEFGKLKTKAGIADLFELTSNSKFGVIKMLQAILVKDNKAYVLTGSMHNSEFKNISQIILKALKSFDIVSDLYCNIQNSEKKQLLEKTIKDLKGLKSIKDKKWKKFEKTVMKEFSMQGSYWQLLVIKDTYQKYLVNKND